MFHFVSAASLGCTPKRTFTRLILLTNKSKANKVFFSVNMRSDDQVQLTSDTEKGTQAEIAMIEEDKYLVGHKLGFIR
ncbi:hypothetical protein VHTUMSATKI_04070 [Vibrio harveyi]